MKVQLDTERCQGHGQCVMTAPTVFTFDDQGFAVLENGEVAEEHHDAVRTAIQRCPERAISELTD